MVDIFKHLPFREMMRYFARLNPARQILWCYLLWWVHAVVRHFDPSPRLWLTSLGISAIIGLALILSTQGPKGEGTKLPGWAVFRLFLMPFCVSSFAALVKTAGFVLIFPPTLQENLSAISVIVVFLAGTWVLRRMYAAVPAV